MARLVMLMMVPLFAYAAAEGVLSRDGAEHRRAGFLRPGAAAVVRSLDEDGCGDLVFGISGYSTGSAALICCAAECGKCGGDGCRSFGNDEDLDDHDCCTGVILEDGNLCTDTGEAPCIISDVGSSSALVADDDSSETSSSDDDDSSSDDDDDEDSSSETSSSDDDDSSSDDDDDDDSSSSESSSSEDDDDSSSDDDDDDDSSSETSSSDDDDESSETSNSDADDDSSETSSSDDDDDSPETSSSDDDDEDESSDDDDDDSSEQGYSYQGCYTDAIATIDNDENADGPFPHVLRISSLVQTRDHCYNLCANIGSSYFGLFHQDYCLCGIDESFLDSDKTEGICDIPCGGHEDEACGGIDAYSLYKMDVLVPTCSDTHGMAGIESKDGDVCCSLGCGTCGGARCVGDGDCCPGTIHDREVYCDDEGYVEASCIIHD